MLDKKYWRTPVRNFNMASKINRINLVYIFLSMSEALVSKHYQENLDLENKLSIHPPVDSHHSQSILRCACFCVTCNGCNCFSFNSQTEMCRLYISCDPSDGTCSCWRRLEIIQQHLATTCYRPIISRCVFIFQFNVCLFSLIYQPVIQLWN